MINLIFEFDFTFDDDKCSDYFFSIACKDKIHAAQLKDLVSNSQEYADMISHNEEYGVHDVLCIKPASFGYYCYEAELGNIGTILSNIKQFFIDKGYRIRNEFNIQYVEGDEVGDNALKTYIDKFISPEDIEVALELFWKDTSRIM